MTIVQAEYCSECYADEITERDRERIELIASELGLDVDFDIGPVQCNHDEWNIAIISKPYRMRTRAFVRLIARLHDWVFVVPKGDRSKIKIGFRNYKVSAFKFSRKRVKNFWVRKVNNKLFVREVARKAN